jgi:hypothetical protein
VLQPMSTEKPMSHAAVESCLEPLLSWLNNAISSREMMQLHLTNVFSAQ